MLNCAAPTKFSRMRLSFSQKTGRSKAGTAAIQCPRPVPCSKGQRVRVLPLPSDAGPAAALAASSGPDTEDLRRKSGQPELRCGADSAGIGAAGRKNQPLRRAARDEKGRAAESTGPQTAEPDESGCRSAKGGKPDSPKLYCDGSQSVRGRKTLTLPPFWTATTAKSSAFPWMTIECIHAFEGACQVCNARGISAQ